MTMTREESLRQTVRVVRASNDPYAGLRGADYIKARGLSKTVQRLSAPISEDACTCTACERNRRLPAVQNLLQARG